MPCSGNWFKLKNCEPFLQFLKKRNLRQEFVPFVTVKNTIPGAAVAVVAQEREVRGAWGGHHLSL